MPEHADPENAAITVTLISKPTFVSNFEVNETSKRGSFVVNPTCSE
jgi:hypothetical protein